MPLRPSYPDLQTNNIQAFGSLPSHKHALTEPSIISNIPDKLVEDSLPELPQPSMPPWRARASVPHAATIPNPNHTNTGVVNSDPRRMDEPLL
jgi:hypothetical protein